jgi:cation transport ATPase
MNDRSTERNFGDEGVPIPATDRTNARVIQRQRESRQADEEVTRSRRDEEVEKGRLEEERASTDSHRRLGLLGVALFILLAAVLEVFAAEPGAEALGFGPLLTYVITAIFVIAVIGGAIMLADSAGELWRFLLGFQVFVLAVLFALRFLYLTAFEPLPDAFLSAAGLTLLTCVIYLITEELARRAETFELWGARRAVKRAERRRRIRERHADRARAELEKAVDALGVSGGRR